MHDVIYDKIKKLKIENLIDDSIIEGIIYPKIKMK